MLKWVEDVNDGAELTWGKDFLLAFLPPGPGLPATDQLDRIIAL